MVHAKARLEWIKRSLEEFWERSSALISLRAEEAASPAIPELLWVELCLAYFCIPSA